MTLLNIYQTTLSAGLATVSTTDVQIGDTFVVSLYTPICNTRTGVISTSVYYVDQTAIVSNTSFDVNAITTLTGTIHPGDNSILSIYQYR